MITTIFGAVLLTIIFVFIYDATMTLFGFEKYTLDNCIPHNIYKPMFLMVFSFSILYILATVWSKLVFGETMGLIFK